MTVENCCDCPVSIGGYSSEPFLPQPYIQINNTKILILLIFDLLACNSNHFSYLTYSSTTVTLFIINTFFYTKEII